MCLIFAEKGWTQQRSQPASLTGYVNAFQKYSVRRSCILYVKPHLPMWNEKFASTIVFCWGRWTMEVEAWKELPSPLCLWGDNLFLSFFCRSLKQTWSKRLIFLQKQTGFSVGVFFPCVIWLKKNFWARFDPDWSLECYFLPGCVPFRYQIDTHTKSYWLSSQIIPFYLHLHQKHVISLEVLSHRRESQQKATELQSCADNILLLENKCRWDTCDKNRNCYIGIQHFAKYF